MALDFPNSPTNGEVYTATSGEQWIYEAATNSWTSKGLVNTTGGLQYKGDINITAAPPTGVTSGSQYSVSPGGTANAGFGPGVTGTVAKGSMLMYTGTGWIETSHVVPDATPAVKGLDTRKWDRTGTVLSPATAGDVVNISAGTSALPGLTPVGDPNTGVFSAGADQIGIATNGTGRVFVDASGRVGIGAASVSSSALTITSSTSPSLAFTYGGAAARHGIAWDSGSIAIRADQTNSTALSKFTIDVDAQERLRITSAGLVGIGTSAPQAKLQCDDSISAQTGTVTLFQNTYDNTTANGTTAYPVIRLQRAGASGVTFPNQVDLAVARYEVAASYARTRLDFRLAHVGSSGAPDTTVMSLLSSGAVGIGTATPSSVFHVKGGNDNVATLDNDGSQYTNLGFSNNGTEKGALYWDNLNSVFALGSNAAGSQLVFRANNAERGRFDASGRLLVGASTPINSSTAKLQCTTTANITTTVYADNTAAKAGGLVAGDIYRKADGTLMIAF
jgi:hypothetical protein